MNDKKNIFRNKFSFTMVKIHQTNMLDNRVVIVYVFYSYDVHIS